MSDGAVRPEIADMRGPGALPRDNGELVFAAPWEGRVLAMAIGVVGSLDLAWDEFRVRLIAEIAADSERPYYESWLAALERLVVELGAVPADKLADLSSAAGGSA
jgi:nitrile hydratase accessory protein